MDITQQAKNLTDLAAALGTTLLAIRTKPSGLKTALTVGATALIIRSWWKNHPCTVAAIQGQQMIDSIKVAKRYGNDKDMQPEPSDIDATAVPADAFEAAPEQPAGE